MIKLLLYGDIPISEETPNFGSALVEYFAPWEEDQIHRSLCQFRPDVIIGYGISKLPPECLRTSNHQVRKRWLHFDKEIVTEQEIKNAISPIYHNADIARHTYQDDNPYISICTGTYNAENFIEETYKYIYNQSYENWEWVVVDDGSNDNTINILNNISATDHRVRVVPNTHIGKIGMVKRMSHGIANGEFLVELDHDDILVETCLEDIIRTFKNDPSAGMVYSNCAEWLQKRNEKGELIPWEESTNDEWNMYQPDYWMYRDTEWNGKICKEGLQWDAMGLSVLEQNYVSPTILHMPICPNHVRAYRADVYRYVGGYRDLVYADDYDLMLRMFIYSKIVHIPKMLYIQRMIQNTWPHQLDFLTPMFNFMRMYYAPEIKSKLISLNLMREDGRIIIPPQILMPNGTLFNKENVEPSQLLELNRPRKKDGKTILSIEDAYADVIPRSPNKIILYDNHGTTYASINTIKNSVDNYNNQKNHINIKYNESKSISTEMYEKQDYNEEKFNSFSCIETILEPENEIEQENNKDDMEIEKLMENLREERRKVYMQQKNNLKLELGCGQNVSEGFIGVDLVEGENVDIVHDLNVFPWPFEDDSVIHIRAYHIFEHLKDTIRVMNECYRILKPGGILELEVPTTDGHGAFSDPTHVSFWNQDTLNYFCSDLKPIVYSYGRASGIIADFELKELNHYTMRENVIIMNALLISKKK